MKVPERLERQAERHALVDGIHFALPVSSEKAPALFAIFPIDARRAAELLPGNEVHPFRLFGDRGLLVITVLNYELTDIGPYVELSIAIACTHGESPAPALLPGLLQRRYGTGRFVLDVPVSSEVSVKGGRGIWGMPMHQASLDFVISERRASSQYDLDGQLAMRIEVDRPRFFASLPVACAIVNYSAFRGMLMKSYAYLSGRGGFNLPFTRSAHLVIGDHPRLSSLKELGIGKRPLVAGFLSDSASTLDDHLESWFLSYPEPPDTAPEGLESVSGLGQSQDWLPPPKRPRARRRKRGLRAPRRSERPARDPDG